MANKHMKRCATPYDIRELKIKTRPHHTPIRGAKVQTLDDCQCKGLMARAHEWPLSRAGTKIQGAFPFLRSLPQCLTPTFSLRTPASEMPRALMCFTSISALIPSPTGVLSLPGGIRNGVPTVPGGEVL